MNVSCTYCRREFEKELGRFNENIKRGWDFFCSKECSDLIKIKQIEYICNNPDCKKVFKRRPKEIVPSGKHYCSSSCATIVGNKLFPKRVAKTKICLTCRKKFKGKNTFCSTECVRIERITKEEILELVREFYRENDRIPLKEEFLHDRAARVLFGTWNNAIIEAGYSPNPVRFAKKYIAKDGHKCDSMAERIIDDWLFRRDIKHMRSVPYPTRKELTVDFLVGDKWIEFFGLSGQLQKYDRLKNQKIELANRLKLNFVQIYPQDLNKLESLLLKGDVE